MEALLPTYVGFLLVLMRCGALCAVAPLFGTNAVPARLRLGLAVALAFVVFSAAGMPTFTAAENIGRLVAAAITETMIGLSSGLAARFALDAIHAAGHAIGLSMGLGYGAVIDPIHGSESTAISELLAIVALGIAVGNGIHREAVVWLCRSVAESPPGTAVDLARLSSQVVSDTARAAALGIRLGFPVMAAVTLGHFAFGIMTRAAPQMNLSNIGFAIAILAGGGALYVVAPAAAEIAANAARHAFAAR